MENQETSIDRLLKARAEIDKKLRSHKSTLTVLFTDIVSSTAYFDRFGDTAGLTMVHRHVELASAVVNRHGGRVIKTLGDSVMAEFSHPESAVRASVKIQQQQWRLNEQSNETERMQIRIAVHSGTGFHHADDVYGDVVNVAARLTKHTGPAQILISHPVYKSLEENGKGIPLHFLGRMTLEGRVEKEDVFEVLWTESTVYNELRRELTDAFLRGELVAPGLDPDRLFPLPSAVPATGRHAPPAALATRYEVLEEINRGGMGIVYKARDRETGDLLALKVLKPEITGNQKVMERFKNELRLARRITHKHVCRIYDFYRAADAAYISMEYIEGESLRSVLRRFGTLPLRKGIEMARQICSALREAHSQGVVHRDLKPENVMLDAAGHIKVMDFGIALSMAMPTSQTGSIIGTPAYMAPEQAEGKPLDHRADIYSLGLLLYEMFTAVPAFTGDTPVSTALKQIREDPLRPRALDPSLPPYLEQVILRCLKKQPAKRFQSIADVEAALSDPRALETYRIGYRLGLGLQSLRATLHRNREIAALSAGLTLVVAAVFLLAQLGRVPPSSPSQAALMSGASPSIPAVQQPLETLPAESGSRQPSDSTMFPSQPQEKRTARASPPVAAPPAEPRESSLRELPTQIVAERLYVHVGSFDEREMAAKLADDVRRLGYRAKINSRRTLPFFRTVFDVLVGPYITNKEARAAQGVLARQYDDTKVVRED